MNLTNLSVAKRLYGGFGLILAILMAVTIVAMIKVHAINMALHANSDQHLRIQRAAINFRGSAHNRSIAIRDVVLANTAPDRQREEADIRQLAEFYAQSAGPLQQLVSAPGASPELGALYAAIQEIDRKTVSVTDRIVQAVESGNMNEAQTLLWTQAKPGYVAWLGAINKLIDFEEARIQAENKFALSEADSFQWVMLGALAIALVVGMTLAWLIASGTLKELGAEPAALRDVARRVAAGDLSPVACASSSSSVLASLSAMQASLSSIVGEVRIASDSIATGSSEIASGNSDLSHRTESQASNVQRTTAAMDQLSGTVQANASTAREANELASRASDAAQRGGTVVGQVVSTMQEITTSSKRIADIIGVIDGIAFQTNILALNAAVEAARAGEQGRGFAVVASEVRSLAQRSAGAAREIKSLIGASVDKVESGSRLAAEAGASMEDIVQQVRHVSQLIHEISTATAAQSTEIVSVGEAVSGLDETTQQNAALVEQSAAAAESLKLQAERLASTVKVFRLVA